MSRTLSLRALHGVLAQQTDEVFLMCITISHSSFADPYRLVNDLTPLARMSGSFEPFAFQLALPGENDDQPPQVQMTIDNVDRKILQAIRTLPAGERVAVALEVVLEASPDTVEVGPVDLKILAVNYDLATITATLGLDDDILNTAFPGASYTPVNSPGVFA